jgi:type II secretory pathway component PulC
VAKPLPRLQLRGIIIHRNEYVALINGNILRLHDTIGGAEVVSIDAHRVVLKYAGKEYTLELK